MNRKQDLTTITTADDMNSIDICQLSPDALPGSIYNAITSSAERFPNQIAIKYILDGECLSKHTIPFKKKLLHTLLKWVKGKTFAEPYREITFSQLAYSVTQIANALRHHGVKRNTSVSIILPNFPEMYQVLWGAGTAGIANPINPLLESKLIKEIICSANSEVLIALGPVPGSDIWQKVLEIKDEIPALKTVISVFGDNESGAPAVIALDRFIKNQDGTQLQFEPPSQNDICAYFHTGGTTGLPKLAKHRHLNQLTNAAQINLLSPVTGGDTMLIGLPIFHVNSAVATGLSSIMMGSTLLIASPSGFRGKDIVKNLFTILSQFDVAFMTAVPTVYAGLIENLERQQKTVKKPACMKLAICGAAPLSADLQRRFSKLTGIPLIEGYGSTEGTSVSTIMPINDLAKEKSVGLALPGTRLKTAQIDEDDKFMQFCQQGEVGEILIAGNNVFPGYVDPSHNLHLTVTDPSGTVWTRSGDLGKLDALGYLSLAGRKKELIIRGGHNIDPKVIEDVASQHPDIYLTAAVPRPDSYAGELPVLYTTVKEGSELTESQLLTYLKQHIPERAAVPKQVRFINEMPLTAVGKIFKPELVCREIKHVIETQLTEPLHTQHWHVNVTPHKELSILALITITTRDVDEQQTLETINNALSNFAFHYLVTFNQATAR